MYKLKKIFCLVLTIILYFYLAPKVFAQSPPLPWEKYNALLNVDILIKTHIIDTVVIPVENIYFSKIEKRVVAKVKIDSVLSDEKGYLHGEKFINILLPSTIHYPRDSLKFSLDNVSFPDFFKKNNLFFVGLVYSKEKDWFQASSTYPPYSFFDNSSFSIVEYKGLRERVLIGRHKAIELGKKADLLSSNNLSLRLVGGIIRGESVEVTKSDDNSSATRLFWSIYDISSNGESILIDAIDGSLLKYLK